MEKILLVPVALWVVVLVVAGLTLAGGFYLRLTGSEKTEKNPRNKVFDINIKDERARRVLKIAAILMVVNLIVWGMIPWVWMILGRTWFTWFIINLSSGAAAYLATNKVLDKDSKPTEKVDPADLLSAKIILGLLGLAVLTLLISSVNFGSWWKGNSQNSVVSRTASVNTNLSHGVPMEVALRVICECESGCRQFNDDGSLLWNKEGSTAVGKYQILASMHEERAKKMGFDIRTEEGNEAYARVLYAESGTKHWEVDPRSSKCWEPKLKAYTWGGDTVSLVVVAPPEKWSDLITTPANGGKFDLGGGTYFVKWNEGRPDESEELLPRGKNSSKQPNPVYTLRLKAKGQEPVKVLVRFY